jgi:hypothetical protein
VFHDIYRGNLERAEQTNAKLAYAFARDHQQNREADERVLGTVRHRCSLCSQHVSRRVQSDTNHARSAAESFTARVEYYESQPGFSWASVDKVLDETVTATLKLAPLNLWMTSRYKEALPLIQEELVAELRSLVAIRSKRRPTRPTPVPANKTNQPAKNSVRRSLKYVKIDEALRIISDARPDNHEEVFEILDQREVPIASRKPFKARGWLNGYLQDRHAASVWLSQRWARLGLPSFARGPKK